MDLKATIDYIVRNSDATEKGIWEDIEVLLDCQCWVYSIQSNETSRVATIWQTTAEKYLLEVKREVQTIIAEGYVTPEIGRVDAGDIYANLWLYRRELIIKSYFSKN